MADNNDNLASASALGSALDRLNSRQKLSLIFAVAATVALFVGMWMWGQTPDYRVLYSNLSDRDGGAIISALQQQNIPYKFAEGGGALMIPGDKVHEVRLQLASQGLPKGGTVGFELMENQKFGTSQFLEQVNYQRALEGELSRSVQTMAAVQNARVHLAIPKPSVFVKEQQKPSASVVLALYPGRVLDPGQVNAIIHLISSSVPEMSDKSVTVVDQSGTLLSATRDTGSELLDASQLKFVRQIEKDYSKRIESIIEPLVGASNVHAQVTAELDFSQSEQTSEDYRPNQAPGEAAVRSQQTTESLNSDKQPNGVPGALSNQPPVPATAPITTPAANTVAGGGSSSSNKEATTNYEVDRTIRHTRLPAGSIKRLSVAVVINHRTVTEKNGKTTTKPLTDAEKEQVTALVKEAMGFDSQRGDSLEVLNSAFSDSKSELDELPLWKQPETISMAKEGFKYLAILGVALFLILGIIRPAFRTLTETAVPAQPEEAEAGGAHAGEHGEHAAAAHKGTTKEDELRMMQAANTYESKLEAVRQLSQQDPKIVATVIKEWVSSNG